MSREAFEKLDNTPPIITFNKGKYYPVEAGNRLQSSVAFGTNERWEWFQKGLAQAPANKINIAEWLIADFRKEYIGQSVERWLESAVEAMIKESNNDL